MANILAAANGNWSSTSTWVGGVVPVAGDNVYANTRTVTIDVNINVAKLSTQAENGATAGGSFSVTCAVTPITITATTIAAGSSTCLVVNSSTLSGRSAIVYSTDVYSSSTSTNATHGISSDIRTGETFYFYGGNLRGLTGFNAAALSLSNGSGTSYITANIYASTTTQAHGLIIGNGLSPTVIINGNIYGGNSSGNAISLQNTSTPNLTITGNIYGGNNANGAGLYLANNNSATVIGNVYGGTSGTGCMGIRNDGTGTITVNGICEAGTQTDASGLELRGSGVGIVKRAKGNGYGVGSVGVGLAYGVWTSTQNGMVYVEELEFGSLGATPIRGNCKLTPLSTNVCLTRLTTGATKTLVDAAASLGFPAISNVRSGVTYNAGSLTGTCAVPSASSVVSGVAVDNTIGTATLTPSNVWDYPISSVTSNSVGEKLKKCAIPADIIALG